MRKIKNHSNSTSVQLRSVAQSCPTLYKPMDCSTSGFPIYHQLLEPTQTYVHHISDAIQPFQNTPFSRLQSSPASESFPVSRLFASGGQSIGTSASAAALPTSIQCWFPLELTGLISLLSKGLSSVFSSTTVRKYLFIGSQPSLLFNSHIHKWLLEKP